jgi:dTDP-4-dehydrorhamnose 3,5-epimerase
LIEGVTTKKLKVIPDERGYLMEMMRSDDPFFVKFGQVYATVCNPGIVKGWHYHKKQTDHWVIVSGEAKVALHDHREDSPTNGETDEFFMGEKNPMLLVIPAGVLHGFTALEDRPAMLVNVPTELYDHDHPDEFRIPHDDPEIGYDWGVGQG